MSYRRQILSLSTIPETPAETADRLSNLSESFYTVRQKVEKAGKPVDKLNADYTGIHDLWTNLELAQGEKNITGARDDCQVTTDPLTQLKLAADYGVMDKQVANDLQRAFNAQVKKIVGHSLTPTEVKRLHALLIAFNPFQPK